MKFKDKVVLVTGAVRNTGLTIAKSFAREGATVVVNSRKAEDVTREAKNIRDEFGVTVVEAPGDVSREEDLDKVFETIKSKCGRLDVLVNNAIVQGVGYSFEDTPRELLEQLFGINVFGSFGCAQRAARIMGEQGKGAIVNVGSNTALRAIKNRTAYIASKGAIDALTRAMAVELGPKGIRVNSVVAGYIHSDRWAVLPEEDAIRRRTNIPLGKEAMGEDIANAIMFMASDDAGIVNGASLVADGGCTCQLFPSDCDR